MKKFVVSYANIMKTAEIHTPINIDTRKEIAISSGDTVRVYSKIEDKGKTRIQMFEGVVIATKHGNEPGATFTVRRSAGGFGVERVFPLFSPLIDKIDVVKRTKVKRSKLYYIRDKASKEIRRQMRKTRIVAEGTLSEQAEARRIDDEATKAKAEIEKAEAEVKRIEDEARAKEEAEQKAKEEAEKEVVVEEVKEDTKEEVDGSVKEEKVEDK